MDTEIERPGQVGPRKELAMPRTVKYSFRYAEQCNMCGASANCSRVLGRRLNTRQGLRPQNKTGIATTIMKCRQCGLIYANPLPIPEHFEQHYDVPATHYWNEGYFLTDPTYFQIQIQRFSSLFGREIKGSGLAALDVGAGIGKGMVALANAGFAVMGIEPSKSFYREAIDRTGISESSLKLATVEEAEFAGSQFDFINMAAVVEHFVNPSEVLRKATRWLKPGGLIHIEVPSSHYLMSKLARTFYRLTGSDYVINTCPMHSPYHIYEFTPDSFRLNGTLTGYTVAHYEYYVCGSYMPRMLAPLFNATMAISRTGMQLAIWLKRHL